MVEAKPSQAKISRAKPSQAKPSFFFRFVVNMLTKTFSNKLRMNHKYLMIRKILKFEAAGNFEAVAELLNPIAVQIRFLEKRKKRNCSVFILLHIIYIFFFGFRDEFDFMCQFHVSVKKTSSENLWRKLDCYWTVETKYLFLIVTSCDDVVGLTSIFMTCPASLALEWGCPCCVFKMALGAKRMHNH